METKYIACILLHALGDTIGFKNGEWEFNGGKLGNGDMNREVNISLEMMFEFIKLGGVNGIDLKGWIVSDDTLFHQAIIKSLINYSGKLDYNEIYRIKNNLLYYHNQMIYDDKDDKQRFMGYMTMKSIQNFSKDYDSRNGKYQPLSGGNGCAMRNLAIGLAFFGEDKLDQLIEYAIVTSKLTHNSAHGYLGGLTSALFASFAVENIAIEKWPLKLIKILDSDKVKKHVNTKNSDEMFDYLSYIKYWTKYYDTRFRDGKPLKTRSHNNILFRIRYYFENFVKEQGNSLGIFGSTIGHSGMSANVMAYDSLLDCDGKWEKLLFYAVLNSGDSDTVGAIAGGLYGLVYGFGDVPENMLKYIEFKNEIIESAKKLYKRYYLGENLKLNIDFNKLEPMLKPLEIVITDIPDPKDKPKSKKKKSKSKK